MDTTPRLGDSDNNLLFKICQLVSAGGVGAGVASFNTRVGAVTLLLADITGALGFTPASNTPSFVTLAATPDLTNERVLTGTANQVILTDNGAGSTIVLSLPQGIAAASTPTFAGLTLTGPLVGGSVAPDNASYLTLGANATLTNERVLTGTANQVVLTDGGAGGNLTLSLPQSIAAASTPTFAGLTLTGPLVGGSVAPSGASYVTLATDATLTSERVLTGTANQVILTDGGAGGNITLSLPQSIATTSTPTFGPLTITGVANTSALTINGATHTASSPAINATQTWNSGGVTFTALKLNVTDTASAAASLLVDLQVAAASKFSVNKVGNVVAAGTLASGPIAITGVVNSSAITVSGATHTASSPVVNATQTWNNAGVTFTGMLLNVTNTASAAASLLADWQIGGASVINLTRTGRIVLVGAADLQTIELGVTGVAIGHGNGNELQMYVGGSILSAFTPTADFTVGASGSFAFSSAVNGNTVRNTQDVFLKRDAANSLAQRNSTTAQTFRVYSSFTDASNYSRLAINANQIASEVAGTGSLAITASTPLLNLAQTWNSGGVTFTGLKCNITDSASAAASLLIDLQVGAASKFNVDKTGLITSASATLHKTSVALTDGAAAQVATLTNGPTAGNPTKWVPINDNGTTRYIPAW